MKKIIFYIVISFINMSCFSQSIDVENKHKENFRDINGAYYEDINSVFNPFEGNWLYSLTNSDGTITSIRFKVKKLENQLYHYSVKNINYHQDVIIVGYQYIENNIEKVNTLNIVDDDIINFINCAISGNGILLPDDKPICFNCFPLEKRVELLYFEPNSKDKYANIILRKTINTSGNEVLEVKIYSPIQHRLINVNNPSQEPEGYFTLPFGNFVLIKQP